MDKQISIKKNLLRWRTEEIHSTQTKMIQNGMKIEYEMLILQLDNGVMSLISHTEVYVRVYTE